MLRNRNIYIEDFFGADGSSRMAVAPVAPATPVVPVAPTPAPPEPTPDPTEPTTPVSQIGEAPANDIVTTEPSTADPDPLIEELQGIREELEDRPNYPVLYPAYYTPVIPRTNPYIVTDEAVVVTDASPVVSGGFGGGSGGGAIAEEEMGEERFPAPKEKNTKALIILVLLAVGAYLAYKYFKK